MSTRDPLWIPPNPNSRMVNIQRVSFDSEEKQRATRESEELGSYDIEKHLTEAKLIDENDSIVKMMRKPKPKPSNLPETRLFRQVKKKEVTGDR